MTQEEQMAAAFEAATGYKSYYSRVETENPMKKLAPYLIIGGILALLLLRGQHER
jgi:hypothetical protein|tara:strand:- start:2448 stop:2612 length:165 start_codon:yes stop_codon:yes gene_type:complete